MKKYVFLMLESTHVGGAQFYVRYKSQYLQSQGYQVFAVCISAGQKEKRVINLDLKKIVLPELMYLPHLLSEKRVRFHMDEMMRFIGWKEGDEVIIESQLVYLAVWGEELARRCHAKHVIYLLGEEISIPVGMLPFFGFKCSRKEVASIKPQNIRGLYDDNVKQSDVRHLVAYMGDVVEEYEAPSLQKVELSDVNFCVFGRLKKAYVIEASRGISQFCEEHSEKTITVAYVGDTADVGVRENVKKQYEHQPNVKIYFCGALSPVPRQMFRMFDVIVAGAGCANVAYRNGAKTVAMNVHNGGLPLGLMGYDVLKSLATEEEILHPQKPLHQLLDEILFAHYGEESFVQAKPVAALNAFDVHMEFLAQSADESTYYNWKEIKLCLKDRLIAASYRLLGGRSRATAFLQKLQKAKKKLLRK